MCAGWATHGLGSSSHGYPTHRRLLAAKRSRPLHGLQPRLMAAMPADHGILATGQAWQPPCLGTREGSHCLPEDALVLILVNHSPVSHIVFSLWLEIRDMPEEASLRRAGADWSYGRYRSERCIYCKDPGFLQTNPSRPQAFISSHAGGIGC